MKRALTPGTFDPLTIGHLDIIERAAGMFDELIVAVAASEKKHPLFTLEERVAIVTEATAHLGNVEVAPVEGLLVDFAREHGAQVLVKGLRATTDFEYEFAMTAANYHLCEDIETIFMMSSPTNMYVSSSLVREIASLDGSVDDFVPPCVARALKRKFSPEIRALNDYYAKAAFEYGFNSLCKMTVPDHLEGKTVLDICCRRGKGVFKFSERVGDTGHVIGIDWVPSYIEKAKADAPHALRKTGLDVNNMEFHTAIPEDLESVGIQDESVDIVWVNSVHNLFADQSRAFRECARVLKPGGMLVCETVYADVPREEQVIAEARALGNVIQSALPQAAFEEMLVAAGFEMPSYTEEHEVAPDQGFIAGHTVATAPSAEHVVFTAAVACARKQPF